MAGGDNGAGARGGQGWRWDVVLSFAGAQRDYVEQVARALLAEGVHCFYDADEEIKLWGKPLAEELPTIYGEQAAAVVVFISAEYASRDWTRLERQAALARAVRERREYVLPARFDDTPLPGLLPDIVAVDLRIRTPHQFAVMIAAKLADLGITAPAGSPASNAGMARPAGAVRVVEADLRRLGVHAAISVPGVPDEVPPEYVPRDADAAGNGVRAKVTAAAERSGFVLLVGGSSVGKTRCAVEAVKALLPDWWLVHPDGPDQVAALAAAPPQRTVVWLDELQRYLDGEHGLTGGVIRALLGGPGPVVSIGTLWPDRYAAYTTVPPSGGADPRAREREVLDLAAVIRISAEFSLAEQRRARIAAMRDPRLREALGAAGYGLTQTLSAAPQLVARWEDAQAADPYAWAVLTAALDAARLGARAPLTARFLRAAAQGYCTSVQQAEAPGNWFEQAMAYATTKLHGAAAALAPAGTGMGQVDGYIVADYLRQHVSRERRGVRVPASTWDALPGNICDPADAARLARSAQSRLLYGYAIPLYHHAADAGDENAAEQLADLLARRGDLDQLRARADAGDEYAARQLVRLLTERGDLDGAEQILRTRADADDRIAAMQLADLLTERGDLDQLRTRADAGDENAARQLVRLLTERGDLDQLRACADAGDENAARQLAGLLTERGDLDEAEQILHTRANAGDWNAARQLAHLLARRGDLDKLRALTEAGDENAAMQLADLLTERGDLDEAEQILRTRADAGDWIAARQLADLLARSGDLDKLRALTEAGDENAARHLVRLLARRGDLDQLRARTDAGDWNAARQLADLLVERGDLDGAEQILRSQAEASDGDTQWLAELLTQQGRDEEAEQLRQFGLAPDGSTASGEGRLVLHPASRPLKLHDYPGLGHSPHAGQAII
jgi:hypothetical protein